MGSIYLRGNRLYLDYINAAGVRKRQPSGFAVGEEPQAAALLRTIESKVAVRVEAGAGEALTLRRYAEQWIKDRRGRIETVGKEATCLRRHVYDAQIGPLALGDMPIEEIRPRHVKMLILALRREGKLAPRSIHGIYSTLHRLFVCAAVDLDGIANPCELPDGVLPQKVDRDSEWRDRAVYTRDELEALISDERIPADRRVLYGLKALAALRHGEAAGLCWRHYDADAKPLGRLTVATSYAKGRTKTNVTRSMPVHPALAKLLAAWKLGGCTAFYGRAPKPDDLIVPNGAGNVRDRHEAQDRLIEDLTLLGLRVNAVKGQNRRGHDLRATMITLAQLDGAQPHLLKIGTHGPGKDIVSVYTRAEVLWPSVCGEVAKLKIAVREGKVIAFPLAMAAGADGGGSGGGGAPERHSGGHSFREAREITAPKMPTPASP